VERVYRVPKIRCEGCAETITRALAGVPGVSAARVAVAEKEVRVEVDGDPADARARQALAAAGFPPA
jgi:copper chaperone